MKQFFPHLNKNLPQHIKESLSKDFKDADKILLAISFLHFLITGFITSYSNEMYVLGIIGGGTAFILSLLAYLFYRGTLISRLIFGIVFSIYPAIMLQQQLGMIEMHFAFFYMVAFLMVYKDISAALIFAFTAIAHHTILTYLQLNNTELMGIPLLVFGPNCSWTIYAIHITMWLFALTFYFYIILKNTKRFITLELSKDEALKKSNELHILNKDLNKQLRLNKKLFNNLEVSIWNEDFSVINEKLKKLKEDGVTDLNSYIIQNQDFILSMAKSIKVLGINQVALDMFEVKDENEFISSISKVFGDNAIEVFKDEIFAIWEGKDYFRSEADFVTLNNKKLKAIVSFAIPKLDEDFKSIPVSILDITEIKRKDDIIYIQSKMAAMGEMIENIAHQWRQPLSIISTASSGIKFKSEMQVLEEEDINKSMTHINDSVVHLSQTIDDFRDFFKADKNRTQFAIDETFEKTFKLIISQFKNANITIIKKIEDITTNGLQNELIQVLINILNNARDELIQKDNQEKVILIDVIKNNGLIEISIKDNAGGVPKDIINRIFESHFTTKSEQSGTGVGLYMSKMIIKEHMLGTIEVSNVDFTHEDKNYYGAQFKICLPLNNK